MMKRTDPYTIENGSERITFTGRRQGPTGECVEIDEKFRDAPAPMSSIR